MKHKAVVENGVIWLQGRLGDREWGTKVCPFHYREREVSACGSWCPFFEYREQTFKNEVVRSVVLLCTGHSRVIDVEEG